MTQFLKIHNQNLNSTPNSTLNLTSNMNETQIPTQTQTQTLTVTYKASAAHIEIKLDGSNYPLWSQVVEMYVTNKDKLGYLIGELPPPTQTDPRFHRWRIDNAFVKDWLINSLKPRLISTFIRFLNAKVVWDAIATTYFDGTDTFQVYNLKRRTHLLRQAGGSIENYYNDLQGLWQEIEFRRPNRMKCDSDIGKLLKYPIANYVSTQRLSEPLKVFAHQLSTIDIPTKVTEALKDPKWTQAMKEEMKAQEKNQTWTLETLP
ncbi:hypothetical protein CerSpe_154070 [Prunus speciosa]